MVRGKWYAQCRVFEIEQSIGVHSSDKEHIDSEFETFPLHLTDMNEFRPVKPVTQRHLDLDNTIIINDCAEENHQTSTSFFVTFPLKMLIAGGGRLGR